MTELIDWTSPAASHVFPRPLRRGRGDMHSIPILDLDLLAAEPRDAELRLLESNHRIKNGLQLVASRLSIQAREAMDPVLQDELRQAALQVLAVARLHERLQDAAVEEVDAAEFLRTICTDFAASAGCAARGVTLVLDCEPLPVSPEEASALGMIVTELATNSLKHAYAGATGEIRVALASTGLGGA